MSEALHMVIVSCSSPFGSSGNPGINKAVFDRQAGQTKVVFQDQLLEDPLAIAVYCLGAQEQPF